MDSIPGSGRSPGGGHGKPTPVFLPGESHGQRSLVRYVRRVTQSRTQVKQSSMHVICTLLVKMQIGVATVENSTEISQKTEKSNCHMTKHFHFPLKIFLVVPGYISPNPQNTNLKRYIHTNIHSKNCQATEQRKCTSMDDWMKKIWNITQP